MDEQLVNEYINNLANQVNNLTQENILLKTRLSIFEKRDKERLEQETKNEFTTPELPEEMEMQKPVEPEPKSMEEIPPLVKAPKPKGYNPKVDGPRPLITNPKIAEK